MKNLLLVCAAIVPSAACTSIAPPAAPGAAAPRTTYVAFSKVDEQYMARIEQIARRNSVDVHWVNPPLQQRTVQ